MRLSADFIGKIGQGKATTKLPEASGISFHSGRVKAGDAFFALPGEKSHGIKFADDALEKGAAFIVSDRAHRRGIQVADPAETLLKLGSWARVQHQAPVIGVTGSAGKTSTKTFLAAALNAERSPGNFNTPLALSKILIEVILKGSKAPLVLEMGIDHIGEMATLTTLVKPSHGILTAIMPAHLEGFGSLGTIAREKSGLLVASSFAMAGLQASPYLKDLGVEHKTYGLNEEADFSAELVGEQLHYQGVSLKMSAPGTAMAQNALAALVMTSEFGMDLSEAARRIEHAELEPGRLSLHSDNDLTIIDDSYNSNPESARQALDVLRTLPKPHTAVLGDMLELGADSERYHLALGKATLDIDRVIAIGPNARFIATGNPKARYFASTDAALQALASLPRQGSILFKASRGMHFETLVNAMRKAGVK